MPRNKNPQETIDKILRVSAKLFVEKGYEHTSIQDIIDGLGGLTKGAIYHHFASKEDIMMAVMDKQYEEHDARWMKVLRDKTNITGLERLRELFRSTLLSPRQADMFKSAPKLLENPKMLTLEMKSIKEENARVWVEPIIREGIADGSIKTDYPQELAEVILLLTNIWVTPLVFSGSKEEIRNRIGFLQQMLKQIGVDLIDDAMRREFEELFVLYYEHTEE